MIISASRRTDIPAFYHRWLFNRLEAGFVLVKNPYNAHQVRRISLCPDDVDVIVFWTRNAGPLLDHLSELGAYRYYFQYTITGYPNELEPHCPSLEQSLDMFITLSDAIGPDKLIWRYDPILLSNETSVEYHQRQFNSIARRLAGKTRRVVISFVDVYQKTKKNLDRIPGLNYCDFREHKTQLLALCRFFADVCQHYCMTLETCAESIDLSSLGINHGKCIDDVLIQQLFGIKVPAAKDPGQRTACRCIKSVDIGQYNTCQHGCVYCYATFNSSAIARHVSKHDAESPFLIE